MFYLPYITKKMEYFSFKGRHIVQVVYKVFKKKRLTYSVCNCGLKQLCTVVEFFC